MIHFVQDLYDKSLVEVKDIIDVFVDFNDIERLINSIWTIDVLNEALSLHKKLVIKYPTIDLMLDVAEKMPKRKIVGGRGRQQENIPSEIRVLNQDKYGILANVLLKKGLIKSLKDFIDYVD